MPPQIALQATLLLRADAKYHYLIAVLSQSHFEVNSMSEVISPIVAGSCTGARIAVRRPRVSESLNPTEGIRLLLERQEVEEGAQSAHYQAKIFTVTSCYSYSVDLKMEGTALLTAKAEEATKEDEEALRKLAKSTARAAKRKLADRLPPWPPRVLRWRGPGRG